VPPTDRLLTFLLASFVLIVIPGPSVLFTIGRALTVGRRGAMLSVLGNATGAYLQVIAVAIGVGTLVQRSTEVYTAIKIVGAAYLIYLGVQAIRHRHALSSAVAARAGAGGGSTRRLYLDGVLVGVANPKTIVFFTVALPQFADRNAGHVPLQLLVLGALFPAIALVCDSVWAVVAGTAREWLARSPRRLAAIGGTGGAAIVGLGVTVAVTGRDLG
jgi:threonine/homoserine/homoserine lactone efflux protein